MDQTCPKCRRISPVGTARCDCGWDFTTGQASAGLALRQAKVTSDLARASWVCPLLAWGSQMLLTLLLGSTSGLGPFWSLMMVVQGILIIVGLYSGGKVLALGRSSTPASLWWQALIGFLWSVGTIILILAMSLASGSKS